METHTNKMVFYHRTTEKSWDKIKKEGVLWGIPNGGKYRYTYLSPFDWGKSYGNILLEVLYEPIGVDGREIDNYGFNPPKNKICNQFSVFIPIPLKNVCRI